jgi:hypothetical protein
MAQMAGPTAALAGTPVGVQAEGVWEGRRQLFVRFAGEGETATLYTAAGLAGELERVAQRTRFHSICATGHDPLGSAVYLCTAFSRVPPAPVMINTNGQRPEAVRELGDHITLVQVTPELDSGAEAIDLAMRTLAEAVSAGYQHALVLRPKVGTSDEDLVAIVGRAHGVSEGTIVVVHPPDIGNDSPGRRWLVLLEQLSGAHDDVRLLPRLPAPTGMR